MTSTGTGWINLDPEVDGDFENPPRSMFAWLFSARGQPIPMITWAPAGAETGAQIGIEHGAGGRALDQLTSAGLPRPEGWTRRADHARRGLVIEAPPGGHEAAALDWAIRAAHLLSPVALTGRWLATVYRPAP